jgi:galactokinase
LGDSLQQKSTVKDLKKVKKTAIKAFTILRKNMPDFNIYETKINDLQQYLPSIDEKYRKKILGNLINRDVTREAKDLFDNWSGRLNEAATPQDTENFYKKLGELINAHQEQLKTKIGISTSKIDQIIASCRDAGALGAKINGSGFGGTMLAFGIGNQEKLMRAIRQNGGVPYKISTSPGVELF